MKTLILLLALTSVCFAEDPNTVDPNDMVTINLSMPKADFDKMFASIVYMMPIPQDESPDPNETTMVDRYTPVEHITNIILQYLDKLDLKGLKRMGGDEKVKTRDREKVKQLKAYNLKKQE